MHIKRNPVDWNYKNRCRKLTAFVTFLVLFKQTVDVLCITVCLPNLFLLHFTKFSFFWCRIIMFLLPVTTFFCKHVGWTSQTCSWKIRGAHIWMNNRLCSSAPLCNRSSVLEGFTCLRGPGNAFGRGGGCQHLAQHPSPLGDHICASKGQRIKKGQSPTGTQEPLGYAMSPSRRQKLKKLCYVSDEALSHSLPGSQVENRAL